LKQTVRIAVLLTFAWAALSAFSNSAQAQKADLAIGLSTMESSGPTPGGSDQQPSLDGGAYPGFSGDVQVYHHVAIGGEVYWKASQGEWGGYQPYRPLFADVNAVYALKVTNRSFLELQGGGGVLSTRFYAQNLECNFYTCVDHSNVNHFAGHIGGGFKIYAKGNFFIRPEGHLYFVKNNAEFFSGRIARLGVSVGYSFGGTH
jgi:hypothetical protein